VITILT
jgi:hypothetical protein